MAKDTRQTELDLFNQWRKTQGVEPFQQLYSSMKNMIHDAARKAAYGSNLPESAHRMWAAQSFFDALRTYDPKSGASLHTHIYGSVHQKAKRLNYMYQNLGYIPEPRAAQVGLYQTEYMNLRDALGREPSPHELSDRLAWPVKDVVNIQKEIQKDLGLGEGTEEQVFYESARDEEVLSLIYFDLTPEEQNVYDYIFGKHGKPRLIKANQKINFEQIGSRCGFSASKARAIVGRLRTKLKAALER